jgi:HK97 family phage major capsid protein
MKRQLIDERVKLYEENKAVLDKAAAAKRTLTPEEQKEFDAKDARVTEIRATLDRIESNEAEERALGESRGRKTETELGGGQREERDAEAIAKDRELATRAWALGGRGKHVTPEMRAACEHLKFDPQGSEIESRALSVGTTDAGGYTVPDEMMKSFWEKLKWFGPMRQLATILNTASGAALPVPTADDTSNVGEIIAEAGAVTTTADPTFGQVVFDAYKYSSKALIVSVEFLQDSSIPVPAWLGGALGTRVGRIQNTHFTTGDASTKPNGVVTASSLGKTAAATNAITFDEIIDLYHAVDIAYRSRPGAGFMLKDSTAAALRKLKDSNNQYLWQMSVQAGQPDTIFGRPVYVNNDMDAIAATKKVVLYGDFSLYFVRDAGAPVFARADELRILNHQVVFLAFQRSDGDLIDTGAVKHLVTAT